MTVNPALGVPKRYSRDPAPVSERSLEAVLNSKTMPAHVAAAILMMASSGLARADAASPMWSHVQPDRIAKRRTKSKIKATPPMTPELADALEQAPRIKGVLTVLTDAEGKQWRSANALGKAVSKAFKDVGLNHTSHDLRATYADFLMRKAANDEEAADAPGRRLETHAAHSPAFFQGRIAKLATERGANL